MTNGNEELIKILHLEDSENDSLLIRIQLQKDHINHEYFFADNEQDFLKYLETQKIDIILSDYNLPDYNGFEALNLAKTRFQHIPFVFVSGTMGEEAAIESLLNGATDYVLKNRLDRLGSAIRRALRESQLRQEYQRASEALRQREEQYRTLVEGMNEGIMLADNQDVILFVNQQTCDITGFSCDELIGKVYCDLLFDEENRKTILKKNKLRMQGVKDIYDIQLLRKDKSNIWIRISGSPVYDNQGKVSGSIGLLENINDRKLAEEELRKLTQAIEQSPDSIIIANTKGTIEYVNPSSTKLTGFSKEELVGQNVSILSSGHKSLQEQEQLWKTIHSGRIWSGEMENKRKNGEIYWESVSISPIYNQKNEITHFLAIKEDVTERKRLTQELVTAKEKAEESDQLKSAFLANISHEIRTPMNGILGFSELLKTPDLGKDARDRYIHVIEQNGTRMLNIINDIVDISKIEAGQMNVHLQETNVNHLLKDLLSVFAPDAKAKGLRQSVATGLPDDESIVLTDQTKLAQILTNLLKNALKFTPHGSIEMGYDCIGAPTDSSASFLETQSEPIWLQFYVKDTGIGIPEDQQIMIFERFRQGSISLSRAYEGAGLGLSISKAFVEMLGGKIWLNSKPFNGSVFYFALPMQTNTISENNTAEKTLHENETSRLNILLAEDDENSRLYLKTVLGNENTVIFEVRNGKDAVESVKNIPELDLVLMDMKMPEMDGYEATRQIKKIRPELPVIAQTAYAFVEDQEKARKAGCDDYIPKPLNRMLLEEKIRKHTRK